MYLMDCWEWKNASLGEQDPNNETDNFGNSLLEGAVENWMIKWNEGCEVNNKCI